MARGKSDRKRYGEFTATFEPLDFHPDLLRIGEGSQKLDSKYPIIEMLRLAKLAFDIHRTKIPKGYVKEFEDRISAALQNAALVEIQNEAEVRLLHQLLAAGEISTETFGRRNDEVTFFYVQKTKEAAHGAAGIMQSLKAAIAPRKPGRPSKRLLPDESDLRDWQVILHANQSVEFGEHKPPPLEQLLGAIPKSVDAALASRFLPAQGNPDESHRARTVHVERISRHARAIFGSTEINSK